MDHAGDTDDSVEQGVEAVELEERVDGRSRESSEGVDERLCSPSAEHQQSSGLIEEGIGVPNADVAVSEIFEAPPQVMGPADEGHHEGRDGDYSAEQSEASLLPLASNPGVRDSPSTADDSSADLVRPTSAMDNGYLEESHFIADALDTVRLLRADRVGPI